MESGIGETLKSARLAQNISIEEVVAETKIRSRYIEAMEEERWDIFPGKVYLKGFLKSYCNVLGLDEAEILARFNEVFKPLEAEIQPISAPTKIEMPGKPQRRTGLLVGILAIIFLIGFNYFYQNYIQPLPVIDNKPPSITEENQNGPAPNSEEDPTTNPIDPVEEEPVTAINLRLVGAKGRCWVRVRDSQQTIYEGIMNTGEEKEFNNLSNVTLMFGNSGVQTFINDEDYGRLGSDEHVVTKRYIIEDNKVKEVVDK